MCIKIMSRKARSLISQIRLGILPLEIEVGVFRGIASKTDYVKIAIWVWEKMRFTLYVNALYIMI